MPVAGGRPGGRSRALFACIHPRGELRQEPSLDQQPLFCSGHDGADGVATRGVDVRVLLPRRTDHLLPMLSSYSYYESLASAGIELWRYQPGFLHQKALLVDDRLAAIGSINVDYRSFHLNFELMVMVTDQGFAGKMEAMMREDFARGILYDTVAGGAGYCQMLFRQHTLRALLSGALDVLRCPAGCTHSCRSCLQDYDNQIYWEKLSRRPVLAWLEELLGVETEANPYARYGAAPVKSMLVLRRMV